MEDKNMKSIMVFVVMVLFAASAMAFEAIDSQIIPGVVNMEVTDTQVVDYCIEYVNEEGGRRPAEGISVAVQQVCLDQNDIFGCQGTDTFWPAEFSVTVLDSVTDADGCSRLQLDTVDAYGGLFFYTVNGEIGGGEVTRETGAVYIPEFGIIGALAVLGLAGVFIARRRN
jgi:hypothetical protein